MSVVEGTDRVSSHGRNPSCLPWLFFLDKPYSTQAVKGAIRCLSQLSWPYVIVIRLRQSVGPQCWSCPCCNHETHLRSDISLTHSTGSTTARMLMHYHSVHWENKWPYVAYARGAVTVKNNGSESTTELNYSLLWSSSEYFKCCLESVGLCASINISLMQFFGTEYASSKSELKCKK